MTARNKGMERRLVAVMFTDMVGYTALMQADERFALEKRELYWGTLERRHDEFGGTIVQRLGDGSMSMFTSSLAAVLAAAEIQRELVPYDVLVRIGVHVGEVIIEPERLSGDAVNIAARIESFAVPGGVMLSDSAYDQIKNRPDVGGVSLGRFRLKNVGRPFELYAVSADGIVVPDPRSLEGKGELAGLSGSLPEPAGPLIGRSADLAALANLVREHRVVTITGPGGVGKTRAVIELGRALAPEFLDGVAFVALADVTDPAQLIPAISEALDVKEAEERTLGEGLSELIGDESAPAPGQSRTGRIGGSRAGKPHRAVPCPAARDHEQNAAFGSPQNASIHSRHSSSRQPSRCSLSARGWAEAPSS